MVERRGEIAVRGGLLDVFPPTEEHPLRVEFWGDEVEEIRYFKAADQRSLAVAEDGLWAPPCRELLLTPSVRDRARQLAAEWPGLHDILGKMAEGITVEGMEALAPALTDRMELLLDYLPRGSKIIACDPERIRARAADLVWTSQEFLEASWVNAAAGGEVPIDLGEAAIRPIAEAQGSGSDARAAVVDDHAVRRGRFGPGCSPHDVDDLDGGDGGPAPFRYLAEPAPGYRGDTQPRAGRRAPVARRGLAGRAGHRGPRPGQAAGRAAARRGTRGQGRRPGAAARGRPRARGDRAAGVRVRLAAVAAGRAGRGRPGRHEDRGHGSRTGCRAGAAAGSTRCSSRPATSSCTSSTASAGTWR